jgi:endoglucanase
MGFEARHLRRLLLVLIASFTLVFGASGFVRSADAASETLGLVTPPLSIGVEGNQLVDGAGTSVTLHGVDISGPEYCCVYGCGPFSGPTDAASVEAMVAWHINAVRVPLNEDCWLGINGVGGATYRNAVVAYVNTLNSLGIYAILDLHWDAPGVTVAQGGEPLPDADHAASFWKSVASTFLLNHAVLFDLFNEPYDVPSWSTWLDGGTAPAYEQNGTAIGSYQAIGMQQLLDDVRSTGATQPALVEGPDWGTELGSSWLSNAPSDPAGQMVASVHVYDNGSVGSYSSNIGPIEARFPVIVGEVGETDCADDDLDAFMPWADANGVSYLAWSWHIGSCSAYPSLITDYNGTPTAFGAGYEAHLQSTFAAPVPPGTPIAGSGGSDGSSQSIPVPQSTSSTVSDSGGTSPNTTSQSGADATQSPVQDPGSPETRASANGTSEPANLALAKEQLRTIARDAGTTGCGRLTRRLPTKTIVIRLKWLPDLPGVIVISAQSGRGAPTNPISRVVVRSGQSQLTLALPRRGVYRVRRLCTESLRVLITGRWYATGGHVELSEAVTSRRR